MNILAWFTELIYFMLSSCLTLLEMSRKDIVYFILNLWIIHARSLFIDEQREEKSVCWRRMSASHNVKYYDTKWRLIRRKDSQGFPHFPRLLAEHFGAPGSRSDLSAATDEVIKWQITDIFRGWKFDILTWPLWQRPLQYLSLVLHLVGHTLGQAPLHSVQLDQPQPVLAPDTSVLIIVLNIEQKIFTLH